MKLEIRAGGISQKASFGKRKKSCNFSVPTAALHAFIDSF